MKEISVHIRWMIPRDLPEVVGIDLEAFPGKPWDGAQFRAILARRDHIGMVAERGEEILGFMVYRLDKPLRKISLERLAVRADHRRHMVGAQMLLKLCAKIKDGSHDYRKLVVDVEEGNLGAQLWLKALGVRAVGVCGDRYRFVFRRNPVVLIAEE